MCLAIGSQFFSVGEPLPQSKQNSAKPGAFLRAFFATAENVFPAKGAWFVFWSSVVLQQRFGVPDKDERHFQIWFEENQQSVKHSSAFVAADHSSAGKSLSKDMAEL